MTIERASTGPAETTVNAVTNSREHAARTEFTRAVMAASSKAGTELVFRMRELMRTAERRADQHAMRRLALLMERLHKTLHQPVDCLELRAIQKELLEWND